ncbi:MAG: methyltransferase domain-containing protein [Terracidiphilus sp.]
MAVNAQYNLAKPDSIPIQIAGYQRRRMFEVFLSTTGIQDQDTVLDLGVTSDQTYRHSNYFESWYPYKSRITACGVDDGSFLEQMYPGLRFVFADGCDLPFADRQFDYVHSSAVLEHVGSRQRQAAFLREAWRVARKGIFITTPNRWFPIEFHTLIPLVHWLPPELFRKLCQRWGLEFFATEDNLNLISASQLSRVAEAAGVGNAKVESLTLGGWPSNLILSAQRAV